MKARSLKRNTVVKRVLLPLFFVLTVSGTVTAQPISATQKRAQLDAIQAQINDQYVMEDLLPAINQNLAVFSGSEAFDKITTKQAFAEALSRELQTFDKHFTVRWSAPDTSKTSARNKEPWPQRVARQNYGFAMIEHLKGNIGYLDLRAFADLTATTRALADASMTLLKDSDVVIIDLRENGGGSPDMVRFLSSFLLGTRTHLNSFKHRHSDEMTEFWTMDDVPSWLAETPLYILTSPDTFSAAEEFTYNMKHLKRATIVGETTRGGANPWRYFPTSDNFAVGIPTSMAVNPITQTNWEGKGVVPHIHAPAQNAKTQAYKEALKWLAPRVEGYAKEDVETALSEL